MIQLQPHPITRTITKAIVKIEPYDLAATQPPTAIIECYEPDNTQPFIVLQSQLTTEVYESWGTDNNVVIDWVLSQHNLKRA